jgi:hypothetical protein
MSTLRKITAKNLASLQKAWGLPSIAAVIDRLAANACASLDALKALDSPYVRGARLRVASKYFVVAVHPHVYGMLRELQHAWNIRPVGRTLVRLMGEAAQLCVCPQKVAEKLVRQVGEAPDCVVRGYMTGQELRIWDMRCERLALPSETAALEYLIAAAWVAEFYTQGDGTQG